MKRFIAVVAFVFVAALASGQTGTPSNRLAWDQAAATLLDASSMTYRVYEASATTITLPAATCTGTASPFACSVAFPAFTPGSHTIQMTASNAAGESAKSAAFTFTFIVVPGVPTNIRIQ